MARCWPKDPDHIMRLYNIGPKKGCDFLLTGVNRISDLAATQKLNVTPKAPDPRDERGPARR